MNSKNSIDLALSFLAEDESIALQLAHELEDRFEVFVYSERQKELAGRDGVEAFSAVFKQRARVVAVLLRQGWGQSKWTGVEETAIKDRAFDQGWDFLVVISLDGSAQPVWIPKTKLWFGYERFGLSAAAAVLDARIQECGGLAREEGPRELATRIAAETARRQERERYLSSAAAMDAARAELSALFGCLSAEARAITEEVPSQPVHFFKKNSEVVMIRSSSASITFGWFEQYRDSLDGAGLLIREFAGLYSFDGWGEGPNVRAEHHVHFTLDSAGNAVWADDRRRERVYSTQQLADHYLKRLLAPS